jgi:uncharacterized protein (TIGR02246 family)
MESRGCKTVRKPLLLICVLALPAASVITGCGKDKPRSGDTASAATGKRNAQPGDSAAGRAAIEKVRDAWLAAEKRDDAAAAAALYTDNAVLSITDSPPARGRLNIQAALAKSFPGSALTRLHSTQLAASGSVGYDFGEFTKEVTIPNQKSTTIEGNYLLALAHQPDGSWRITKQVFTKAAAQATELTR